MILLELICVMENSVFSVPVDMFDRNSVAMEGMEPQVTSSSLVLLDSFNQNQTLGGYTALSTLPGEPINDLHSGVHVANRSTVLDSDELPATIGRHVRKDPSLYTASAIVNNEFHEQFVGGTPSSYAPLARLLAARSDLQQNPENFVISESSICQLEPVRNFVSNVCCNAQNFSFASSINYVRPEIYENMNGRVVFDRFPGSEELVGRNPVIVELQSSMENLEPHCWISSQGVSVGSSNPYGSSRFNNELSLGLATAQPSVVNGTNISDQSSVISSGLTKNCLEASKLGSDQTSSSSRELSLSCASNRAGQFSQVISASRYLHVIQEILAQIASYSIENLDQRTLYSTRSKTAGNMQFSDKRMLPVSCQKSANVNGKFEVQMDPALQKRALEAKKTQLQTLLQMVDDQYNQCLDEIYTVISAFHAATELDPHIHARFALQTISFLYKSLRERISNQILSIGAQFDSDGTKGTEESFETSFLQKQWTLQQLKKKDQQLWRPQRGLPERSVSVLRAWMFQNFLHPYPKDSEKHLLAVKSGLTRSQVSNWFINARVRLWKPMIEEMYAEMNKRKSRQIEDGTSSNHRSQIGNISNIRMFNVN